MKDYDVIVIGGGNAAYCSALAAREAGCREIRAEYLPTAKNAPCLEFWMRSGFDRMGPDHLFVRDSSRDYPLPPVVTLS